MSTSPQKESLTIAGPAGPLEALLEQPQQGAVTTVAVVCHPHPQHGGTMLNKVVHTVARAMVDLGHAALRFNYRGVGASAGSYADGEGELQDALAVVAFVRERWPDAALWLAGFSFGGVVAARAAAVANPACLITIAPAVNILEAKLERLPTMPWLIVQGEADDVVPAAAVQSWVARCGEQADCRPELVLLPGVGHFFHGELGTLRTLITDHTG
ncbi:MAG: alpha/beta fold hydrolase [Gammaproteobacteria bacterium]|jgi:alpha/beta superfamily hydrolase|nr:alpha/beta fold hydrolase [Gammaproteobacteria bacterium]